ncbi:TetM/TetW/TetO/TetS family tetracycline resistance ribosomal protection protein [Paenibacillus chondroitinus]|uniref:TetM/TetW/TetO/TetS family tetracycline resistance ribosomal protection protein n=1 Tax=Paenibacillus chondroitinus TaxID=59842 RepID=A0ABU6DH39_9BACL|nr:MULTISPECIES: TetM/TetW/TetO/TetS family tetracycline resistance ribosomal protection protein [Paenibacillus]MCY9661415.1 TetM/TetW/TetO/TetS family tetracycline resistance ribosomal protection protein [Paenibacillus anseongense]MEB4797078.1 TetM/TetW/TetO/TetS family tetracycline resistance ribosomal protection protein [Paenibacillus chondroitinus]
MGKDLTIPRRNVGIFAHVDAGKTTTTEHLLYHSGRIRALGSVDSGTAQTDSMDVERERGISVRSATTTFTWKETSINLVDTPGHVDFLSEVERSLRVMDGAILIVSAVEGVQSQTEMIWHALQSLQIPTLLYVNKMDRVGADADRVLRDIEKQLTGMAVPIYAPLGAEDTFRGAENVLVEGASGAPGFDLAAAVEKLSELDEQLLTSYIEGVPIPAREVKATLQRFARQGRAFPLLVGASSKGLGIEELMEAILDYLPGPSGSAEQPLSAVVFKVERDKTMGRMAYVRLYEGAIRNRDTVLNATRGVEEKVTQIRKIDGRRAEDIGYVAAGDIAAICGLTQVRIGDVLGRPDAVPPAPRLAVPLLTVQVHAESDAQYPALVAALQELTDEDPLLDLQWLQEERELHVKVMGAIQLEILTSLLASRFGLQARFDQPSVIYKETPSQPGEGFIAYTMPKPCWAILRFRIEPGAPGSGLVYSSQVRADQLLAQYQSEVERRVPEALQQGLLGWEVTDLKVTLVEGEHHVWHTHPLDFAVATPMGLMQGLAQTGTTLLEPMLQVRITVPEVYGGKVLSDLVQMRASFDPPQLSGDRFVVEGRLPVATSLDYPVKLSAMSGGRGVITSSFGGYQPSPPDVHAERKRRGVNPLDQSKYILAVRKALST